MTLHNRLQNINVVIADDHPSFREGLRLLLEADPKIRVVGEARDGKEAVELASKLKPNLVLLDLRMPRFSGMDALKSIHRQFLPVRRLILATEVRKSEIVEALSYGASGVVLKGTATALLRKSIFAVMAGQYWIEREGVSDLGFEIGDGPLGVSQDAMDKNWRLTPREKQIVAEVVSGKTNNEISQTLGVSAQTVKHHLTSIFDKVGVYNRLELALFCVNHSFASDDNVHDLQMDDVSPPDQFGARRQGTGPVPAKPVKRLYFVGPDRDVRESAVRPQAAPYPAPSRAKKIPS
jgi:two-component system nitrate/nitrite response regulator NarL